jgi:hypothetical protein
MSQRSHNRFQDVSEAKIARLDYEEAWKRLFPVVPKEGWYWHTHKCYPVYIAERDGQWWATEIIVHTSGFECALLTPGLYEQLLPIERHVATQ